MAAETSTIEIVTLKVTIQGMMPLILNRFTEEEAANATHGKGRGRSSIVGRQLPPLELARKRLYLTEEKDGGIPYMPASNLLSCIMEGGKYFRQGRRAVTTNQSSILAACLTINPDCIPIQHDQPWRVDIRAVRIPATGGRVNAFRPVFDDWQLDFDLTVETDMMDPILLHSIVTAAGRRVGLGDYRPQRKGPYGRFIVTRWEEEK